MRLFAKLCLLVLGLCGCTGSGMRSDKEPVGAVSQALVATSTVLADNIKIHGNPYFENTAKVVPPSTRKQVGSLPEVANCPNGQIALMTGERGSHDFVSRPLLDGLGKIDFTTSSITKPVPDPAFTIIGTDNQVVRMKDGSLVAVKGCNSWGAMTPPPPYANAMVNTSDIDQHAGARGGNMCFFRSTDCGANWSAWGPMLDFGTFGGGTYGYPRPAKIVAGKVQADLPSYPNGQGGNPPNNLVWWIGGADREELYACPFTGNVYLTVHIVAGPYCIAGGVCPQQTQVNTELLIMNTGTMSAPIWSLVTQLPSASPTVMTSTPDGRLFLLGNAGLAPSVRFSTQAVLPGVIPQQISTGYDASFKEGALSIPIGTSSAPAGTSPAQTRGLMMIKSDHDPGLAFNAAGGAVYGADLKMSSTCDITNPSCTWSYRNGMIVSDANPKLAINAWGGAAEGTHLRLTDGCDPTNPDCTFTYKKGEFLSDKNPNLAINAWGGAVNGATLLLTGLCSASNPDCTWTLPHVELSSDRNPSLRVNATNGAANAVQLTLSDICASTNPDCTWTFSKGMIKSDRDPSLAFNAEFGALNLHKVKLSNICSPTEPACNWTWTKGKLVSDGSGATPLPINAAGGAVAGAILLLNSACNGAPNADCMFSAFNESVDIDRSNQFSIYLSRISSDTASSKVRLVYPSLNGDNMQDARIVNFDANNPTSPVSFATVRAARPQDHSVMFTTFVDPDYVDMPADDRSNISVLYWEEAPTPSSTSHTYSARYLTISGESDISSPASLSVSGGSARTWGPAGISLGDYVTGGFYWRNKTLNYLAQWVEPDGIKANIVTVKSPMHGFMIQSDRNPGLAFNAAGGAVYGADLKMSSICAITNTSCTWSYRSGMIVSDANPMLAINAWGGAAEGTHLRLTDGCIPSNPDCTWTYKNGEFLSDRNPALAINAWGGAVNGATLLLTSLCTASNPDCTWTVPNVELTSAQDTRLAVNAAGGAANAVQLKLSSACTAANTDCTWTFSKGMIKSDTDSSLAFNAEFGAADLRYVKLSSICSPTEPSCKWTWTKGELVSDGSGATPLPINAFGGAVPGAVLRLNSACTAANNDCVFSGFFAR